MERLGVQPARVVAWTVWQGGGPVSYTQLTDALFAHVPASQRGEERFKVKNGVADLRRSLAAVDPDLPERHLAGTGSGWLALRDLGSDLADLLAAARDGDHERVLALAAEPLLDGVRSDRRLGRCRLREEPWAAPLLAEVTAAVAQARGRASAATGAAGATVDSVRARARSLVAEGRPRAASELLAHAADERFAHDPTGAAALEHEFANLAPLDQSVMWRVPRRARRYAALDEADPAVAGLRSTLADLSAQTGATAREAARRARRNLARRAAKDHEPPLAEIRSIWLLLRAECFAEARAALDAIIDRGDEQAGALARAMRLYQRVQCGELETAIAEGRDTLAIAARVSAEAAQPFACGQVIHALVEARDLAGAEAVLAGAPLVDDEPARSFFTDQLHLNRARLRIAQGRPAEALEDLYAVGATKERIGVPNPTGWHWQALLADALRSSDPAAARHHAEAELLLTREWGTPAAIARSLRALAALCPPEGARDHLEEAHRLVARSPARLERYHVLRALAAATAPLDADAADRHASAAEDMARAMGIPPAS